eukprot:2571732-Alexandrium_andersonii.AAC.1
MKRVRADAMQESASGRWTPQARKSTERGRGSSAAPPHQPVGEDPAKLHQEQREHEVRAAGAAH